MAALTSQKWAEKAKNVLAIKILYQNLKKSTFKLFAAGIFCGPVVRAALLAQTLN